MPASIKLSEILKLKIDPSEVLDLYRTDSVLVLMQPSCPDSIRFRDMLSNAKFTKENGCDVKFVNVRGGGEMMSSSFVGQGRKYPDFTSEFYNVLSDKDHVSTVLPKIYKKSLGGIVQGCYYRNHGKSGINKVNFIQ